jgi:hypothetical protein
MNAVVKTSNALARQLDTSERTAAGRRRLAKLRIRGKFAVVRLWPGVAVAEHENIERIREAAKMLGLTVAEVDEFGRLLDGSSRLAAEEDFDFVLNLHFKSPKNYGPFSVGALWNPLQFYVEWGFERYWSNQMSHDLLAGTGSGQIADLIASSRGRSAADMMPRLNHTLAAPILIPEARRSYRAFYCGINWQRINGKRGRHDDLLRALDRRGLIDIYGPKEHQGVRVWEGFSGYRGSLPFDGRTVIERVWEAGASLVLSSDAHKDSDIMSNRLFEAMAGGAVVIADDHAFIPGAIGENFIRIPEASAEQQADYIAAALNRFAADPSLALQLASAAQTTLLSDFFLCDQLVGVYEKVVEAKSLRANVLTTSAPTLDIVLQALDRPAATIVDQVANIKARIGDAANIIVLISGTRDAELRMPTAGKAIIVRIGDDYAKRLLDPLRCLQLARDHLKSSKVAFFLGVETVISGDFLTGLAGLNADCPIMRIGYAVNGEHGSDPLASAYMLRSSPGKGKGEAAAAGTYVFDRNWLEEIFWELPFSPAGLFDIAANRGLNVKVYHPTQMLVDVAGYQALLERGFSNVRWRDGESTFINFTRGRGTQSFDSVTLPARPAAELARQTDFANIAGGFKSLPSSERQEILKSLVSTLPMVPRVWRLMRRTRQWIGRREAA